ALGPVRAAQPVQGRVFAADVARYLIKRVHWYIEPVARLAAPGRRVLDHQGLSCRAGHRPLRHLDIATDPVLTVHHRVAGNQLEWVDLILAARRHLPVGPICRTLAREIRCGEESEPDLVGYKSVGELA